MPNCVFYAIDSDFDLVLDYVFEESGCRVFEMYSPYGEEIAEFSSISEIKERYDLGKCNNNSESVYLQLWNPQASQEVSFGKIDLNPEKCNGHKFRYQINGWGLIQLYLGGIGPKGMVASHTNHNTEKRALKWSSTYHGELGDPNAWQWPVVSSTSSRLNRFIRKISVSKQGSRPILAAANESMLNGVAAI